MENILREECFVLNPREFQITCDKCGSTNIEWSEYEGFIWCYNCKIDTKGTPGIFDGPISVECSKLLLGENCFDKINIKTGELIPFKSE